MERKKVENTLEDLETKLKENEVCDELKFTPEDILIKRDIDFINSIKYPEKYKQYNRHWNDFTRDEKVGFIMNYIDEITLSMKNSRDYEVEFVKFRESIANSCNELYYKGYIDRTDYAVFGNVLGTLRYSEYQDTQAVWQHILRLREFYDVRFFQATYNVENCVFHFNGTLDNRTIVRVFPMEDYRNIDPDRKLKEYDLGVLYVVNDDGTILEDEEAVFKYIPDETDGILTREVKPTLVKPATELGMKEYDEEIEEITTKEVISS